MLTSSGLPIQDLKCWCGTDDFSLPIQLHLPEISVQEALNYCKSLTRKHYENFSVATFLLPRELRPHFFSIYAYCRWADDLGDEISDDRTSLLLLDWWEGELDALFEGKKPLHPVFMALSETIHEFSIPKSIFADLLKAFRQDRIVREYETREQLLEYCRCSANPVGRLILHLARTTDEESLRLSDAICTGLQLANFWQDVKRDWQEKRRIYLPLEDWTKFNFTKEEFLHERSTPEFQKLLAEEVRWAESFFETGFPLTERVPRSFQLEIRLFHDGGRAILEAVKKQNYRVWEKRPTIGKLRKLRLLWNALRRKKSE